MKTVFYPGSFDPITNGHLDIIQRATNIFDSIRIVVMHNSKKKYVFTADERIEMIEESLGSLRDEIVVEKHDGLLVEYCRKNEIYTAVRGIRALTDFDFEFQMALTNRQMDDRVESVLFVTNINYSYVSSSLVNEIASYKGDVSFLVPKPVEIKLKEKYQ